MRMTRIACRWMCLLAAPLLYLQSSAAESRTPNILWIIGEDLGPDMACYGNGEIWTPAIDQLAAEGVRYTRAYTVTAVCSTSRSSFMTGMYSFSIGAHNHRSHRSDARNKAPGDEDFPLPEGVRLLTDRLRDAGYFTANLVNITGDPKERFYRGTGKTDWNFKYDGKPFDSSNWSDLRKNQPFYAQINFPETHRGGDWDRAHQQIDKVADPARVDFPPYYPDHPVTREVWAQYHNAIMALDKKVAYLMKKLEEDGLADNTVVVFLGDHGRAMVRSKQWPYESGLSIPLIIRWPKGYATPGNFQPGSVDDRLVTSLDLTATTLSVAGVTPPILMQGRVFLGDAAAPEREYAFGGRDRGDETVDYVRTVRDKRFRYIRNFYPERPFLQLNRYKEWSYPILGVMRKLHAEGKLNEVQERLMAPTRPAEELYDLDNDPFEIHNLASDPAHAATRERLSSVLSAFLVEVNDQGRIPEAPETIEFWEQKMIDYYDEKLEQRDGRKPR